MGVGGEGSSHALLGDHRESWMWADTKGHAESAFTFFSVMVTRGLSPCSWGGSAMVPAASPVTALEGKPVSEKRRDRNKTSTRRTMSDPREGCGGFTGLFMSTFRWV